MTQETYLLVGLGNPGRVYLENRHNIGFMLVDRLAVRLDVRFTRLQSRALVASAIRGERKLILAKPQTFMNLSGQSVQGLVRFYKLPLANLLVAHDDLDLPPGAIRIRPDGGSAGQRGMESIIQRLGTDGFARLRLGIGRPPGQLPPPDYVLQDFSSSDLALVNETLERAVEAVLAWLEDGVEAAMNRFNGSTA
ncbi:MAG: aminoacyl-tRNA hydrolase [Chloroflexi bacterium]|nr:aminoacyl-tRNA hydrolase [Chloroflexota bacterium]